MESEGLGDSPRLGICDLTLAIYQPSDLRMMSPTILAKAVSSSFIQALVIIYPISSSFP